MSVNKNYNFILKNIDTNKINNLYKISIVSNIETVDNVKNNITKISELNDKKIDTITFLDNSKQLHKCIITQINYENKKNIDTLNYYCFWDHHKFDNNPIGCPIRFIPSQSIKTYYSEISKNTYTIKENITKSKRKYLTKNKNNDIKIIKNEYYETDGIFCSFECCMAYINENKHNVLYNNSTSLLLKMFNDMYGKKIKTIMPAPHYRLLIPYGGYLNIESFRKSFNKHEYIYQGIVKNPKIRPISMIFEKKLTFNN